MNLRVFLFIQDGGFRMVTECNGNRTARVPRSAPSIRAGKGVFEACGKQ